MPGSTFPTRSGPGEPAGVQGLTLYPSGSPKAAQVLSLKAPPLPPRAFASYFPPTVILFNFVMFLFFKYIFYFLIFHSLLLFCSLFAVFWQH